MPAKGQKPENTGMARCVKPVAVSVLIGAVCCSLTLLALSVLLSLRNVPQSAVDPMAGLALMIGGFAAGFACAKIMRENGLAFGALCGAVLTVIVLVAGFAVGDGGFGVPALLKTALVMLSAMVGGVLGVNTKRRRGR